MDPGRDRPHGSWADRINGSPHERPPGSSREGPPGSSREGPPGAGREGPPGAGRHRPLDPRLDYEARLRGHDLAGLALHWGEVYEITWTNGMFRAARRDNGAAVWAGTIADLRELIKNDYLAKGAGR